MLICAVVRDFAAHCERQLQPALSTAPLIIYERNKGKASVYAMCEQARTAGVTLGMTQSRAQALCPEAQEVDAHPRDYQRQANAICKVLLLFSARIESEQTSGLTIWLDAGKQSAEATYKLAGLVRDELFKHFGLRPSIGVTSGRWSARTAAHITAPGNIRCLFPKTERTTIWKLQLNQFTISERFAELCEGLGLKTVGEFARLPWAGVRMCFGEVGYDFHRILNGHDRKTLQLYQVAQYAEQQLYFDGIVEDKLSLEAAIHELAARLSADLITRGLACSELTLQLECDDKRQLEIAHIIREPVQQTQFLAPELLRLLDQLSLECGVESMRIQLDNLLPPAPQQLDMFTDLFEQHAQMFKAITRRLRKRHPQIPIMQFRVLDTTGNIPELNFVTKEQVAA